MDQSSPDGPVTGSWPQRVRRAAVALSPVAVVAVLTGVVLAAYTARTANPANGVSTGTVAIGDNDAADAALFPASAGVVRPGVGFRREACITVTYTGTLPADVSMRANPAPAAGTGLNIYVDVDSTPGGAAAPSCAGFGADPGSAFVGNDPIETFPTTFAAGYRPYATPWQPGESRTFWIVVTLPDDPTPNAHTTPASTGTIAFTWEARNV